MSSTTDLPAIAHYDVAVIGGGAAGLSAATALARSRRSVLVVDAGEPRNGPAEGAHNVLGQDGVPPLDLLAAGRKEAIGYGAEVRADTAVAARREGDAFEVDLEEGGTVRVRRLVLASGLVDELPDLPGVKEMWGRKVLHCPYCHGWEVRDQRVGVIGVSPMSVHQALLFRQLTADVTLFTHTMPELDADAAEQLAARQIRVVDARVEGIRDEGEKGVTVVLDGTPEVEQDAVVVAPRFHARADLYVQLGGTVTDHPFGEFIDSDPMGKTEIPGVWAAGNASDLSAMVMVASGAGVMAGAAVNADLIAEDVAAAVDARAGQ
ncbi:NAD(P)/FAD-dependent oxidoreductase [Rhodococcus artemisiae]|uniref:NAD(P)/FAD-dependent oxidoreductase n=1 Tax=Rhodococcus artemisiae TaxID=714159 RepID=A0ABU7LDD8_9NOCA|nr:NAD(P)/FAD-dependent oxidoreductase [Rhodococcus artemisiae]MEE2059554.1 NAD(P)/FAD-dependent oxidoreductase [Rhodococcus artemisiae]